MSFFQMLKEVFSRKSVIIDTLILITVCVAANVFTKFLEGRFVLTLLHTLCFVISMALIQRIGKVVMEVTDSMDK